MRTIIINKSAAWLVSGFTLIASANAADHDYVVAVDASLSELRVEARFDTAVPRISARSRNAARYLMSATDCETGDAIPHNGRRLEIGPDLRCLEYTVDLAAAARGDNRNSSLDESNIVVSPTVWLWRPRIGGDDAINVRFELPDDVRVSVPWQSADSTSHAYRLSSSPQSGSAIAVFGRFDTDLVEVAGVNLRVVFLNDRSLDFDHNHVEWIRATAANIALAYGRFPNPGARVVLFPTRRWFGSPVRFGRVVRDGGETIELMVNPGGDVGELYQSWTATHEFSHLMVPYIDRDRRWISEGFAQYYQNILLARAGQYTQQIAWQKLNDGLERGLASAPRLSPNAATETDARGTRMKVYWSGAALALMADVELRRRSNNAESLDSALGRLQQCCLPSARVWDGIEFFEKLDEHVSEPVFVDLYERYGDAPGFPEFRELLTELGVELDGKTVVLNDDAKLAEIRAALTGRRYTDEPE